MSQTALDKVKQLLHDLDDSELSIVRDQIVIHQTGERDDKTGSADISADDEKKKYIAQHGNPNAQTRAQDVPQPASDEVKDLQNLASMEENRDEKLSEETKEHVLRHDTEETQ